MTGAALPAQPRQGSAPTTAGGVRLGTWLRLGWFGLTTVLLRRRDPIIGSLIVTDRCNLACRHCAVANIRKIDYSFGRLRADLQYGRIDEILATGLHAYLTQFLERVGTLGVGISRDFLIPGAA